MFTLSKLLRRVPRLQQPTSRVGSLSNEKQEADTSTQDGFIFQCLPADLFLEVCDHLSRRDLKSLRLVCKETNALVTPILFRCVKLSVSIPESYTFCGYHRWFYHYRTSEQLRPQTCDGKFKSPANKGKVVATNCPFLTSPTGLSLRHLQSAGENRTNPILEPLRKSVKSDWLEGILAHAQLLTITVPPLEQSYTGWSYGDRFVDSLDTLAEISQSVIPKVISAANGLRRLNVKLHLKKYMDTGSSLFPELFRSLCELVDGDSVQIHIAAVLETEQATQIDILRSLSKISSLRLALHTGYAPGLNQELQRLVARSPKLRASGVVCELVPPPEHPTYSNRGFLNLGTREEIENEWYLRYEGEELRARERRINWHPHVTVLEPMPGYGLPASVSNPSPRRR